MQIEEEQFLLGELKKIEARKKERERKTQDLQKLISQADNQTETPRKSDKKLPKKKVANPSRPSRVDTSVRIFRQPPWNCLCSSIIFYSTAYFTGSGDGRN